MPEKNNDTVDIEETDGKDTKNRNKYIAVGLAIGVAIGAGTGNIGLGIALGLVFGVVLSRSKRE